MKVYVLEIKTNYRDDFTKLAKDLEVDKEDVITTLFDYAGSVPSYEVKHGKCSFANYAHMKLSSVSVDRENPIQALKQDIMENLSGISRFEQTACVIGDDYIRCTKNNRNYYLSDRQYWYFKTMDEWQPETEYIAIDTRQVMICKDVDGCIWREPKKDKIPTTKCKMSFKKPTIVEMKTIPEIFAAAEKEFNCKLYPSGEFYSCQYMKNVNNDKSHVFLFDAAPQHRNGTYHIDINEIDRARRNHKLGVKTTFFMFNDCEDEVYEQLQDNTVLYIHYTPLIHYYLEGNVCLVPLDEMKAVSV